MTLKTVAGGLQMTLKTVAGRLETAAETDPGLVIALRAAYRGRHDVQDALWWRAHPLSRTPGGRPDPLVGLGEEQAAVYSRSRIDGPRSEVADPDSGEPVSATLGEHRLRELTRLLAQDAAALDLVLVSFRGWPGFGPEDDDPEPHAAPAPPRGARHDRRPARGILLVAAGGAAGLLIGVAATLALRAP